MKPFRARLGPIMFLLALLPATQCIGQTKAVLDAGVAETVKQFNLLDAHHPDLIARASGALVFPQVTKGGVALASEYGEGALLEAGATVGYYSVASASVGLTAGMRTHCEIILFMTPDALARFKSSRGWSLGADAEIAVMSSGMADSYDSARVRKPVLVFVFSEHGLLADISLQGSKINKIAK